jgi:acyl transferase domain-containing protein
MSRLDPLSEPELSLPAYDQSAVIAIVGMSCRFPKAAGPDVFWRLLCNSEDAITEVPTDRQEIRAAIRYGGFIDQVGSIIPESIRDSQAGAFFGVTSNDYTLLTTGGVGAINRHMARERAPILVTSSMPSLRARKLDDGTVAIGFP